MTDEANPIKEFHSRVRNLYPALEEIGQARDLTPLSDVGEITTALRWGIGLRSSEKAIVVAFVLSVKVYRYSFDGSRWSPLSPRKLPEFPDLGNLDSLLSDELSWLAT